MHGMRRTAAITGKGAANTIEEPLLMADLEKLLGTEVSTPKDEADALCALRDRAMLMFLW